jgi:carbamate kinase
VFAARVHQPRASAGFLRVPLANKTLVPTPGIPSDDLLPGLLTTSDILGTGWLLMGAGVIVICAGGGGIPVVTEPDGALHGVEAVIDKDLSAALLAEEIGADALLLSTDVPAVWSQWPMTAGHAIGRIAPAELRGLKLRTGSMGPRTEAACRFVERTGRFAAIGALDQAQPVLDGNAGTVVAENRVQ